MKGGQGFTHHNEQAIRKIGCKWCGSKFDTPLALNQHVTDKHLLPQSVRESISKDPK